MLEEGPEEDKKNFEAEGGVDDDSQPDPEEHLMLEQGNGRVWLVKIPKFLMERWAALDAEDIHLATIRVYSLPPNPPPGAKPRIILFLPPNRQPNGAPPNLNSPNYINRPVFDSATSFPSNTDDPDWYELDMVNDNVENQMVVAERPKDAAFSALASGSSAPPPPPTAASANSRARTTILTGRIKHECNLRPKFTQSYRRKMQERQKMYTTPKRTIKMIEDAGVPGGKGGVNRLTSGVGVGAGSAFGDLIKTKPKQAKGTFERMARMPRNQLLDQLFVLFKEQPRWSLRPLRDRTQQPEVYLKEVLSEIAFLHKFGEYNGLWELKEIFRNEGQMRSENVPGPSTPGDMKMEEDDFDEDDDDDDEDMEEIS